MCKYNHYIYSILILINPIFRHYHPLHSTFSGVLQKSRKNVTEQEKRNRIHIVLP